MIPYYSSEFQIGRILLAEAAHGVQAAQKAHDFGGAAKDCGTHWCGGPDFCAEIASPGDRSRDKLDFYAAIGVRELLLIDRDPWLLELYQLTAGRLARVAMSDLKSQAVLTSSVLPLSLRLVPGTPRAQIEVVHRDGVHRWLA